MERRKKPDKIQKWFGFETYYSDILHNMIVDKVHHDEKTNWVLGISALILSLTLPNLRQGFTLENSGFIVIFSSSLIAFLISLLVLDIPSFFRKIPHSEKSLMYYHSYKTMSPDEYAKRLRAIDSIPEISNQYAYNIANIVNRNNYLKRKLLKWPIFILFWGVLVGFILVFLFGTGLIAA